VRIRTILHVNFLEIEGQINDLWNKISKLHIEQIKKKSKLYLKKRKNSISTFHYHGVVQHDKQK